MDDATILDLTSSIVDLTIDIRKKYQQNYQMQLLRNQF